MWYVCACVCSKHPNHLPHNSKTATLCFLFVFCLFFVCFLFVFCLFFVCFFFVFCLFFVCFLFVFCLFKHKGNRKQMKKKSSSFKPQVYFTRKQKNKHCTQRQVCFITS